MGLGGAPLPPDPFMAMRLGLGTDGLLNQPANLQLHLQTMLLKQAIQNQAAMSQATRPPPPPLFQRITDGVLGEKKGT